MAERLYQSSFTVVIENADILYRDAHETLVELTDNETGGIRVLSDTDFDSTLFRGEQTRFEVWKQKSFHAPECLVPSFSIETRLFTAFEQWEGLYKGY